MNPHIIELINQYEVPGDFTYTSISASQIEAAEAALGVKLPKQYIEFLMTYGHGGIGGVEVLGFGKTGTAVFVRETLNYRQYGLPNNLVIVENCDEWIYCIDCNSEAVVSWSFGSVTPANDCFDSFLLEQFVDAAENS